MGWDRRLHQRSEVSVVENVEPANSPAESLTDTLPEHYFELYSLAVEMADRISGRRVIANSFFATVHTGLIAAVSTKTFSWYVTLAGILLAIVWWALLKSYRDLNSAKFQVINSMEARLPAKIFSDEWVILKGEKKEENPDISQSKMRAWLKQYRELGAVERMVPWLFAAIYAIDLVSRLSWPDSWKVF